MKEYKVLKEFEGLQVGDILKYDEEYEFFVFSRTVSEDSLYSEYTVHLSKSLVENYAKAGWLEAVVEDEVENEHTRIARELSDKVCKLQDFIAKQKEFYQKRNERMQQKYENGKMQACVKVEHDTVYFNMMKLLNKIESIIA